MPTKSRWGIDIPILSLPSLIFGSPDEDLPNSIAYADTEDPDLLHLSLADYALWSRRLAVGLLEAGLRPQDRVLVCSGNNVFFPVVLMGTIMAGGIITTANPAFVARELAYQLKDSEPRFLLVAQPGLEMARQAANIAGYDHRNMFIFDDAPLRRLGSGRDLGHVRHWQGLIASIEAARAFTWDDGTTPEFVHRTVAILYSSGTTGVPKGVEVTHYSLVANCRQLGFMGSLGSHSAKGQLNLNPQRLICPLPMYHGLGLLFYSTVAPYRRLPCYLMKKYSLQALLGNIERFKITDLMLVPPMVVSIAKSADARSGAYDLSSVRRVSAGAAPLSRQMCAVFESIWPAGQINVKQGWGMTETPTGILQWDDRQVSTTQAVGEPVPNCEAKLMDETGLFEVPPGEAGELWILSPTVMKGYWNKPEATRDTLTTDGWMKTGDIAFQDKEGRFSIIDRKKELIKVKGNQVAPAELERVLLEHPEVQDAAVIGIKVEEDERPLGYVVRKPDSTVTTEEILSFMKERTTKVKWLYDVQFTSSIPKNPSGKILRRQLRDMAATQPVATKKALVSSDKIVARL